MGLIHNILIVGGLLTVLGACSQGEVEKVEVIRPVKLMDINVISHNLLSFPGEVKASNEAKLAFRVAGQIQKFHVNSGQMVKKGELLVELDPKDYEYTMQAQRASFDLSTVEYRRNEVLIKDFLISQEDYDISKSNMQVADSNYKTAQANLSYTKIYMPYDGIIANTYVKNYESITAQEAILSVQSHNAVDVVINVPERLIAELRKQYSNASTVTQVSFPLNLGVKYDAVFKDVSTIADKNTGSYEVTLTIPKPENINLYSGMAATGFVELNYENDDVTIHIPESAFIRKDGQTMIWKYLPESNSLSKISIATANESELISLLNTGDQIVMSGVNELSEGMKVKPWKKERGL